MIQEVIRHSDQRVTALYVEGHVSLMSFAEEVEEYAERHKLRLQSRYSPYWDSWDFVLDSNGRYCIRSKEGCYKVTAIDLLKWKR